jgi:hypothetical protein
MEIKTFLLEPRELYRFALRRYTFADTCVAGGWHRASVGIGDHPAEAAQQLSEGGPMGGDAWSHEDPRWPTKCAACPYVFAPGDPYSFDPRQLFQRSDTGEIVTLAEAPPGAIWAAPWLSESPEYRGPDGLTLVARCPDGHDWIIDSRASNCDSPCAECGVQYKDHTHGQGHTYRDARPHKCWVRHGTPPQLHVDKGAGESCGAGAGSIQTATWHGFLHNGFFRAC